MEKVKVSGQEQRPHMSLQMVRGPKTLLGPWEGWDHSTQTQSRGTFTYLAWPGNL
jgi:hypothetical protein